jgi:dTDP-4-dehydrorhamnose 3,5-epimerase
MALHPRPGPFCIDGRSGKSFTGEAMTPSSVQLLTPRRFADTRGWFMESYSQRAAEALGIDCIFVQDNHSYSRERHTLRGLHFQTPPATQAKLVSCVRGRIWDVAVDIRAGSPTYGRWTAAQLSAENGAQLFVPVGYAHGFLTLEPDCEVTYKVSGFYSPEHDGGLLWSDPAFAIDWPLQGAEPRLSARDALQPTAAEFSSPFAYDGVPLRPVE